MRRAVLAGLVGGYVLGKTALMGPLAANMLKFAYWDLGANTRWDPDRSFCIFHRHDEVINFRASSIYPGLEAQFGPNLRSVELFTRGNNIMSHMYSLPDAEHEFAQVTATIT